LTVPILALSQPIQNILDLHWAGFSENSYVLLILSALLFCYGGWPVLSGLIGELPSWQPGMVTLVGVSITVAFFHSSAVRYGLLEEVFCWESATLIDIMLRGHWIEMKSVVGASPGRSLRISCGLLLVHSLKHRKSNCLRINEQASSPRAKAGYNIAGKADSDPIKTIGVVED
jgi:cation transport ATPase